MIHYMYVSREKEGLLGKRKYTWKARNISSISIERLLAEKSKNILFRIMQMENSQHFETHIISVNK